MDLSSLTALSPLDGRYATQTEFLRPLCSEYGLIAKRVLIEIRWFESLAADPEIYEIPPLKTETKKFLDDIIQNFSEQDALQIKSLEKTTLHDVKAVEYFLQEKFKSHAELQKYLSFIHFSCTSEDINNLSYALILHELREQHLLPKIDELISTLTQKAHEHAKIPMLARTHGQAATPTTVGKEIANFSFRLTQAREQLSRVKIAGKHNGAVGNYNAQCIAYPTVDWQRHSRKFIKKLGLHWHPYTTQIQPHDDIAEYCDAMARLQLILIDLCRDFWGYISLDYFTLRVNSSETGSSTMPHKVNPIDFENAEGNFGLSNALLRHLSNTLPISRWQRDLSDSTLLRNLGVAYAHGLLALQSLLKGLAKITPNTTALSVDLDKHWEVLSEAVQTVMRRYGISDAYEQLKSITRGQAFTPSTFQEFVRKANIPTEAKTALLALTPREYLGLAVELAENLNQGSNSGSR